MAKLESMPILILLLVIVIATCAVGKPPDEKGVVERKVKVLEKDIELVSHKRTKPIDKVHKHGDKKTRKRRHRKHNEDQENSWFHCTDGTSPVKLKDIKAHRGVMCSDMYPINTCCSTHDITMELDGDKLLENIKGDQCINLLMTLRCAHCSPRSWWLFLAPDYVNTLPHRRILPIMCPRFCKKFHRICRNSLPGLEDDNFCKYNTSPKEGPCFPDSEPRRGTID